MKSLGLYIHIPFCRKKCLYCDFCSFPCRDAETHARYAERVRRDLAQYAEACADHTVDTIYFGGGTPTLLAPAQLTGILDHVRQDYRLAPDAEITLECNPATVSEADLRALRTGGFNRISIGLQSSHENELRALGRIHTYADFSTTFAAARAAGFANISVDLMSGIPEQTAQSWVETIERVAALGPEHISAYGLIVEAGTPFFERADSLALPDEETARRMYFDGIHALAAHGYAQYEISNFAKAGYESRHNLKYWNCDEYLGFGPSAYSDYGGDRFGNSRDLDAYLSGEPIEWERETPSREARMSEYVMLRMRLCEGVIARDFEQRFGVSFAARYADRLAPYAQMGLLSTRRDATAFTAEGFYVSNAILSEILDFSE
ncbi:MAG: radical SAM family heme chaperone HemW [Ruminococcaceae bacterium]|nr:radical SAM family heme chaperone HemW [Oscillospiraceae bacterium]